MGVNSDVPSAVLATVTSGTYRNTRLMGTFQRHEERLVPVSYTHLDVYKRQVFRLGKFSLL